MPKRMLLIGDRWMTEEEFDAWDGNKPESLVAKRLCNTARYRRWRKAVLYRASNRCSGCGAGKKLKVVRRTPLSVLVDGMKFRQATLHAPVWELDEGIVVCSKCEALLPGEEFSDSGQKAPTAVVVETSGPGLWNGGRDRIMERLFRLWYGEDCFKPKKPGALSGEGEQKAEESAAAESGGGEIAT